MTAKALKDYKVLVFDVYATLIDWETGIYTALQPLLSRQPSSASTQWTKKALLTAFSSVERDLQAKHPTMPYNELLAEVYKALAERISLASAIDSTDSESALAADVASPNNEFVEEGNAFARSLAEWPPFPDTVEALNGLKRLGYKLVILSNVDDASIKGMTLPRLDPESYVMPTRLSTGGAPPGEKSAKKAGSDPLFTLVLTAQQLCAYKPDPRVLSSALEIIHSRLGVVKEDVLVVAQSLFHDHVPAKSLGLGSVWIDREGSEMGLDVAEGERNENGKGRIWDWRFRTLGEMVAAVEEEKSQS